MYDVRHALGSEEKNCIYGRMFLFIVLVSIRRYKMFTNSSLSPNSVKGRGKARKR